jgi:hypothetical protein
MVLRTHAPILPRRSVISRRCNAIRALEKVRLSAATRALATDATPEAITSPGRSGLTESYFTLLRWTMAS